MKEALCFQHLSQLAKFRSQPIHSEKTINEALQISWQVGQRTCNAWPKLELQLRRQN